MSQQTDSQQNCFFLLEKHPPLLSVSFVCVNKPEPWPHWPLAHTSAMEMSHSVSTVSKLFSNLLILVHVGFAAPLYQCLLTWCLFSESLFQTVDFIFAIVCSFCLLKRLSTCPPQWPSDMSFCNLISHRKCCELIATSLLSQCCSGKLCPTS